MFACRSWQRCGPLARHSLHRAHLSRDVVPRRLMSSVPGGSGENIFYTALCGAAFAGALAYAYRTVATDRDRFIDRISEIEARPKTEWKPKPWPPKSGDDGNEASGSEEAEATETAVASENEAVTEVLMETTQASRKDAGSLKTIVEKVAETVVETAEVVAEVAEVVAVAAEEVATVAEEVEKVAKEVEAAAEAVVAPVIQAEEPASESNVAQSESVNPVTSETAEMAAASVFEVPTDSPVEPVVLEEAPASLVTEEPPTAVTEESQPVAVFASEETVAASEPEETPADSVTEDAPVVPVVEEVIAESLVVEVAESAAVSKVEAEAPAPTETSNAPDALEEPVSAESKKDYVVVVLEGAPKTGKKPNVLGVSTVTGKIIPAPDNDVETSGQATGQASIA